MYCVKCGKEIESGQQGYMCSDCAAGKTTPATEEAPKAAPTYDPFNRPSDAPAVESSYEAKNSYTGVRTDSDPMATNTVYQNYHSPEYSNYQSTLYPEPNNRMYGFGKALASTIMSMIGFFIAYFCLLMAASIYDESLLVLVILSLPLAIISIVFGAKSIGVFKSRKAPCVKPIATLILGIVGLSNGIFTAYIGGLSFILAVAMSM